MESIKRQFQNLIERVRDSQILICSNLLENYRIFNSSQRYPKTKFEFKINKHVMKKHYKTTKTTERTTIFENKKLRKMFAFTIQVG